MGAARARRCSGRWTFRALSRHLSDCSLTTASEQKIAKNYPWKPEESPKNRAKTARKADWQMNVQVGGSKKSLLASVGGMGHPAQRGRERSRTGTLQKLRERSGPCPQWDGIGLARKTAVGPRLPGLADVLWPSRGAMP